MGSLLLQTLANVIPTPARAGLLLQDWMAVIRTCLGGVSDWNLAWGCGVVSLLQDMGRLTSPTAVGLHGHGNKGE